MFGPLLNLLNSWSFFSISMDCNTTYHWKLAKGEMLNVSPLRNSAIVSTSISTGFTYQVYKLTETGLVEETPSLRKLGTGYKSVNFGGFRGKVEITATEDIDFYVHVRFPQTESDGIIEIVETDKPLVEVTTPPPQPERPAIPEIPSQPDQPGQAAAPAPPEQNAETGSINNRQSVNTEEEACSGTLLLSVVLAAGILFIIMKNRRRANHGANEEMDISDDDFETYVPRVVSTQSHKPSPAVYQQPYVIVSQPTVAAYSSPLNN